MSNRKYNVILNQLPVNLRNPTLVSQVGKISIKHKKQPEFYKETYVNLNFFNTSNYLFLISLAHDYLELHEIHSP